MTRICATINGTPVPIMTEANSISNTPALPLKASRSTHSRKGYLGIGSPITKVSRGIRTKKATVSQITGKTRVDRGFNQRWITGRQYRILVTSMSDTSAYIDTVVYAESLRGLMLSVVSEIGKLNKRYVAKHFSVTLSQIAAKKLRREETITVVEGVAITPEHETPITPHGPIDEGLEL